MHSPGHRQLAVDDNDLGSDLLLGLGNFIASKHFAECTRSVGKDIVSEYKRDNCGMRVFLFMFLFRPDFFLESLMWFK